MSRQIGLVKHSPGRPSKLTPETEARIVSAVRCGASFKSACMAGGISERTFQRWRQKGELPDAKPEYRRFWRELTQAEQEGQTARVAIIQKAARDDWRASAWLLERMDPERWSLRHKIEHTGSVGLTFGQVLRLAEERNREASGMSLFAPKEAP